jgi:uncharacterized protein YcfJ
MNFTPKMNVGALVSGILTIAVVGLIGPVRHLCAASAPIVATHEALAEQAFFQTGSSAPVVPAVELAPAQRSQTARPEHYQPVTAWYKNKHWWKKNAPIIGGAAGGGLIGGLAGGGKGAIIGGAAGGGGGYLYKRLRHHHPNAAARKTHAGNASRAEPPE